MVHHLTDHTRTTLARRANGTLETNDTSKLLILSYAGPSSSRHCTLRVGYSVQALEGHTDEVWHVQFSHQGDRLASASKDQTAIIWTISMNGDTTLQHVLKGHPHYVTHLTWSKDDSKMLTCSANKVWFWRLHWRDTYGLVNDLHPGKKVLLERMLCWKWANRCLSKCLHVQLPVKAASPIIIYLFSWSLMYVMRQEHRTEAMQ